MGLTLACFQSDGTRPVAIDFWNIRCKEGVIVDARCFSTCGCRLSGPKGFVWVQVVQQFLYALCRYLDVSNVWILFGFSPSGMVRKISWAVLGENEAELVIENLKLFFGRVFQYTIFFQGGYIYGVGFSVFDEVPKFLYVRVIFRFCEYIFCVRPVCFFCCFVYGFRKGFHLFFVSIGVVSLHFLM